MAENFSDEGLTLILNHFPRQSVALPSTVFLGLFTAQSISTVPPRGQVLGSAPPVTGVVEPTDGVGAYARPAVTPNSIWGAPVVSGGGVRTTTTSPISFAESTTGGYSPTSQKGFIVVNQLAQGAGSIAYGYANFDEAVALVVDAGGFVVKITPTWHWDI
jgi:hypothetical protein